LNFFGILGILILLNNNWHLINVEDSFHLCPNVLGILKISSCFRKFGQFENLFLSNNFEQIMKVKFFFCQCPPSRVLSHTLKINVLHPEDNCPIPLS
jgi:hypothetical protein